ncbi:hypothetical protein [Cellulosimicrobium sp. Marseille-Q4280]|uniref:hypothetical protein n=1 Tax=Cellulosimicrobium sp. Marseille-Q4280 TaxID=2937992 RepID=UPI00203E84FF|nr:hypothetical protein [Cellulosimicrobium sp. Marseille-Q4280]
MPTPTPENLQAVADALHEAGWALNAGHAAKMAAVALGALPAPAPQSAGASCGARYCTADAQVGPHRHGDGVITPLKPERKALEDAARDAYTAAVDGRRLGDVWSEVVDAVLAANPALAVQYGARRDFDDKVVFSALDVASIDRFIADPPLWYRARTENETFTVVTRPAPVDPPWAVATP